MKRFLPFIFMTLMVGTAEAQNPNLGTGGAQFLQIPVGAREEAMAGAVAGYIDDASSVFWNPAGMVKVKNVEVFFSYTNWLTLFDHSSAAIVYNIEDVGAFGVSFINFSTKEMEITTETEPNGTGRYFDAGDLALGVSYARYLTDRFSVGLTAKYIHQQIWNETAAGFAFDIGTQYRLDFQNLTIAMCMANFGGDMRFDGPDLDINYERTDINPLSRIVPGRLQTEDFPLPLHFQVGIGFDVFEADFVKMRGAIDATHPNDNNERVLLGTEFSFFDRFYLRGGYKFNFDDQKFAFGAGANVPVESSTVYFDYSYSIFDLLPLVHRISVRLLF